MNTYINKLSCWYIVQSNYLSGPLVYDQIYHISISKQSIPDQAALELPDLGLLCLQKLLKASLCVQAANILARQSSLGFSSSHMP